MRKQKGIFLYWKKLGITTKFGLAFGALLALLVLITTVSIVTLTIVRRETETAIITSTDIQYLVLEMDRRLEKARRLEGNFFLRYPTIGYSAAYQQYAEPAGEQVKRVSAINTDLQHLISESDESEAWQASDVNLNLYFSAVNRHAATVEEATGLIAQLAADETGLQTQLARNSSLLQETLQLAGYPDLMVLYYEMQSFEKDYLLTRQRPFMQSAFNTAFSLRDAIQQAPALDTDQKTEALTRLDNYLDSAAAILELDVAVRGKFNELDLQAEAVDPITTDLLELADQEVERARTQINQTGQIVTTTLLSTALVALALAGGIALVLNNSITRNIVKLTQVAGELEAGNLEVRAQVDSDDELGRLAASFNAMAARLQALVGNLEQQVADRTTELTAANKRLTILREIDRDIVVARSPEAITSSILKRIHQLIPCSQSHATLFNEDIAEAVLIAVDSVQNSALPTSRRISVERNHYVEQLKAGQTLLEPDLQLLKPPLTPFTKQLIKDGIRSGISVPLLAQEQLVGVLSLLDTAPNYFNADHQEIIEEIANLLAIAIHQHRLSEQVERHAGELEDRVHQRTAELEASNKEMEAFTYTISHDLKAPLRGIDGYSRLLLEDYDDRLDDDGRIFLKMIRGATQQMSQLIEDRLAYSHLQRRHFYTESVNPQALVEAVLTLQADELQTRGIDVSVTVPCRAVTADRDGLVMALRCLLDNAIKFTDNTAEPAIEIGGWETENSCILWVRDNGVGFDMKFHDRIFKVFQRLQRAEDYSGTGVGLAMVHGAMQRMGGNTWAESELGRGATFYLEIPKAIK